MKHPEQETVSVRIPAHLKLLCDLLDTTPEGMLQDFINEVSFTAHRGKDIRSHLAMGYFAITYHNQSAYTYLQLQGMLRSLYALTGKVPDSKAMRLGYHVALARWYYRWRGQRKPEL